VCVHLPNRESFESITVWLMPPPVEQTADLNRELQASDLSASFKLVVIIYCNHISNTSKTVMLHDSILFSSAFILAVYKDNHNNI
jgi:hypothetical protein